MIKFIGKAFTIKRGLFILVFIGLLLLTHIPALIASGLVNAGMVEMIRGLPCNPINQTCDVVSRANLPLVSDDTRPGMELARGLFESALKWQPNLLKARVDLASAYFSLGERANAAMVLPPVESVGIGRTPLVTETRYEYQLVQAEQAMQAGRWDEAIRAFRLGMALGGDRVLPVDISDLFLALANQISQDSTDSHGMYLKGKYLSLAGRSSEAVVWLGKATNPSDSQQLGQDELAWAYFYLGDAWDELGDMTAAEQAYQKAINANPNVREPYARLVGLLRRDGKDASKIETELSGLGPGSQIGLYGGSYQLNTTRLLPNGWRLDGYDLDEQLLDVTSSVDLLLWWKSPAVYPDSDQWITVGNYKLAWQKQTNLFANAGFEWGVDDRGIPLGQDREYYGAPAGRLGVREGKRNGELTHVLFANNTPEIRSVALASKMIPMDPNGYYLMAGWLFDQDRFANLGRNCNGRRFGIGEFFNIAGYDAKRPVQTWIHVADFSPAFPGRQPDQCEMLVTNLNSTGQSMWDNILLVRLQLP